MTATPTAVNAALLGAKREPLTLASPAREIRIEPATGEPGVFVTVRAYVGARRTANRRNVAHIACATRPVLDRSGLFSHGSTLPLEPKEIAAADAWLDSYFGQEGKAKT